MTRLLHDLVDLVLPVTCAGCARPGRALCPACLHRWSGPPRRCEHAAGRLDRLDGTVLPVWALAVGAGTVRRAVVAWKDGGRADVSPWFAAVVRRAAPVLVAEVAAARAAPPASGVPGPPGAPRVALRGVVPPPGRLVVVPAPASRAGAARRGEDLVAGLAGALAAGLADAVPAVPTRPAVPTPRVRVPAAVPVVPALRLARGGADQVGLGVRGRAANLAGRVRVHPRARAALAGADVLLVDDVLTTGATLAACRAALEREGARPRGAVVLAVTPPPGAPPSWLEPTTAPG
ncbi:ComF family protein [Cellulomonas sp. C5510]|uniref:ComF family protein n=1 Tax=Cellulomonas sp. C5510 TaxID=2871170 RepID=UPI001C953C41|nr:phosphoribosyltransferase family protein [Cellulomonas sp. C5510]QZN84726.1 ComF family protein [Cellulomonas sp. C5510]